MTRPGTALLWILACASIVLLVYESTTLVNSVWRPLLANPQALQTDFHYYYDAAQRFSADRSRLYLPTDDVIAGFAYPPPAIVPFMWLSRWPLGTALLAMSLASYLALIATLQYWIRFLKRQGYPIDTPTNAALLLVAVALGPTYMNAIFGQVNVFVLASAVVFVTMAPVAPLEAGAILAAGIWLKVYPALLAVVALWDRRVWWALLAAFGALLAIAIVLLPIVPFSTYATFVFGVLPARGDQTAIHITNQSLVAFLERFGYPASRFLNWTGEQAVRVTAVIRVVNWIFAALVAAWLTLRARRGERAAPAAALIALIAVVAPLGWGHTYVLVLPLVIWQLVASRDAGVTTTLTVAVAVTAMMIPAGRQFSFLESLPAALQNVVYSRYLIATVALMFVPRVGTTPLEPAGTFGTSGTARIGRMPEGPPRSSA